MTFVVSFIMHQRQQPSSFSSIRSTCTTSHNVTVAVRVRPLTQHEQRTTPKSPLSWSITNSSITQQYNDQPISTNIYSFDNVFDNSSTNQHIFEEIAKPIISSTLEGTNAVIFAYGQTASGKTHTMLGNDNDPGVTKRSISHLFSNMNIYPERHFVVRASYIEIYNEIIRDLLRPTSENLKIHHDDKNNIVTVDSHQEVVTDVNQVMHIIEKGETVRAIGRTNMNDRSSRSHTILSLNIESTEKDQCSNVTDNGLVIKSSVLSLVDLAGSERVSFTKAQGIRLVEGGHINKSLLTLGTIINKLSSNETKCISHLPFRDSKLTRVLQPALGGNAKTAIICTVTPDALHVKETLSTLKFATRAKRVVNKPKQNEFLDDRAKLIRAEKQIALLTEECNRLRKVTESELSSSISSELQVVDTRMEELEQIRTLNKEMKDEISLLCKEHSELLEKEKQNNEQYEKHVKTLQTKIFEADIKYKTSQDTCNRLYSEKTVLEREIKDRDVTIKNQTFDLENYWKQTIKATEQVQREILDEKNKYENDTKYLREENNQLMVKAEYLENKVKEQDERNQELEMKYERSRKELIVTREYMKVQANEVVGLKQLVEDLRDNEKNHLSQIQQLEKRERSALNQHTHTAVELGLANVKLKEMKEELSKTHNADREYEQKETDRLQKMVNELTKSNEEQERLYKRECEKVKQLQHECNIKTDIIIELTERCEKLEMDLNKQKELENHIRFQMNTIENESIMSPSSERAEISDDDDDDISVMKWKDVDCGNQIEMISSPVSIIREENDSESEYENQVLEKGNEVEQIEKENTNVQDTRNEKTTSLVKKDEQLCDEKRNVHNVRRNANQWWRFRRGLPMYLTDTLRVPKFLLLTFLQTFDYAKFI